MNYNELYTELLERVKAGTLEAGDIDRAEAFRENAPELWQAHTWLRVLGGWSAEVDEFANEFIKSELELEEGE